MKTTSIATIWTIAFRIAIFVFLVSVKCELINHPARIHINFHNPFIFLQMKFMMFMVFLSCAVVNTTTTIPKYCCLVSTIINL